MKRAPFDGSKLTGLVTSIVGVIVECLRLDNNDVI